MAIDQLRPRCSFPEPGTAVACAVSGGADSLALLALAVRAGCDVTAIHVDHQLRSGSATEGNIVAIYAAETGARFEQRVVEVGPGPNVEARAREARYAALPTNVMTGHTADDQAETVILNLMRGSIGGLGGMRPLSDRGIQRPLLALRRSDTIAVCAEMGWQPITDPTNMDLNLRRNAVRHRLLPAMSEIAERDVVPILTRQADLIRDDSDLLDQLAAGIDPTDAPALANAPLALARRAIRQWLAHPYPPDAATVERVLAVARGEAVACQTNDGRLVSRSAQKLNLSAANTPQNDR